jgi:hypothetical protein
VLIMHLARARATRKNKSSTRWKRLFSFKPWPNYLRWKSKVWNMMPHAQKPDFVFRRNGWVHLRQFSRLLAAEVCASALVMLDTPRSEVVLEYWLPSPIASFPFTSSPLRRRVPSGFKRTLHTKRINRAHSRSKSENPCPRRKQNSGLTAYSPLTVLGIPTLQTLITRYMLRLRYYCGSRVETYCSPKPYLLLLVQITELLFGRSLFCPFLNWCLDQMCRDFDALNKKNNLPQ